jgi:hypothetical protein
MKRSDGKRGGGMKDTHTSKLSVIKPPGLVRALAFLIGFSAALSTLPATATVFQATSPADLNQTPYTFENYEDDLLEPGIVYTCTPSPCQRRAAFGAVRGVTPSGTWGYSTATSAPYRMYFDFVSPVSSFGLWFGNDETCCTAGFEAKLHLFNGVNFIGTVSVTANLNDYADQFVGFTSDESITRVQLIYDDGDTYVSLVPYIDDLYFNVAPPTATPTENPTSSPTDTRSPTATPSATDTQTQVPTMTATDVPTATPSPSVSETPTPASPGDPVPTCPSVPFATCNRSAEKSLLKIVDSDGGTGDRICWTWQKGVVSALIDFGNPVATTSYAFCLYDHTAGNPVSVLDVGAVGSSSCDERPCWRSLGSRGFFYKDRAATSEGLKKIRLIQVGGKASITVALRGINTRMPNTPMAQDGMVTAQLISSIGQCWSTDFFYPPIVNRAGKFRDRND